ncbi:MAG: hypothetical protein WCA20_36455 [Candidatus Sulfotelmatobacter sp.]
MPSQKNATDRIDHGEDAKQNYADQIAGGSLKPLAHRIDRRTDDAEDKEDAEQEQRLRS